MNQKEFKEIYFTDNFYWVNKENYRTLQDIAIKVGCLCHTGDRKIIEWHDGFSNLGFRTYARNNHVTVFQKEPFLLYNEKATDYQTMLSDYEKIK